MDLATLLKERIARYLEAKEGRSLRMLAARTGLPQTTLWAISKGTARASFTQALSLLTTVAPPEEAGALLEEHFPDEAKRLARLHALTRKPVPSDTWRDFLTGPIENHIFTLASTRKGVTVERVRELYGEAGLESLRMLEEAEILVRSSCAKRVHGAREFATPASEALASFRTRLSLMRKDHLGTPDALLGMLTESVSAEAQARIRAILGNALREVYGILSDPANDGDKVVFVGCALALLDDAPAARKEVP